ncbi:MAG: aminoglycoside phosphotransferase family protein [Anaerolineae bacterium]
MIDADEARGVLLLRRVRPGTPLLELVEDGRDEAATRAAAAVTARRSIDRSAIRAATRSPPSPTGRWASAACAGASTAARSAGGAARGDGGDGVRRPIGVARFVIAGRAVAARPAARGPASGNVLASTGGWREGGDGEGDHGTDGDGVDAPAWLAIDPQGVIGEPAYEAGAWLRNPLPWLLGGGERRARSISTRRVAILAEALGVERERIAAWGAAQAVLSAWWSIEDHGAGWGGGDGSRGGAVQHRRRWTASGNRAPRSPPTPNP